MSDPLLSSSFLQETEIPEALPGMRLASTVVFPLDVVSVQVDRPRSRAMLDANPGDAALVAVFFPREPEAQLASKKEDFFPVGVACRVIHRMRLPNDALQVVLQGLRRIRLVEVLEADPWFRFAVEALEEGEPRGSDLDTAIFRLLEMVDRLVKTEGGYPPEMVSILKMNIAGAGRFCDLIGAHLNLPLALKRHIVEATNPRERLRLVEEIVGEALGRLQVRDEVAEKVKVDLNQRQRETLLRAHLRAIHQELGLEADAATDILELHQRLEGSPLPTEAREAAARELERMKVMTPAAGEYHVLRTYVTWLLDLPWSAPRVRRVNLTKARRILDREHYGLEDVKQRILEYLAVRRLREEGTGPGTVLCLVGPPGVGKTSLGESIATATGRQFVRLSVGGVHDEAEIRGHRRTYVGALPGKIVQTIRRGGVADPLFLIDEIDKLGHGVHGDPSSAMLEVLDPGQNATFLDHYLDVSFDLSRVFFVCTANDLDAVMPALRDRMEVVRMGGYTRLEKMQIARRYILPQVLAENGLSGRRVAFTDEGLLALIDTYTREAGVRDLRRLMARVCRARALEVATGGEGARKRLQVDPPRLDAILGPAPHAEGIRPEEAAVGVASGLAWSVAGGEILRIEAAFVPGSGRLRLTGRLGEVMRESAETALSYVSSLGEDLDLDPSVLVDRDIHLHVPAGATPKDGPSAGVAIAACLASLLSGRPVRPDLAMTGEITLKGRVLAVGGIREKVLAAHRFGYRQVLLPEANRRDLAEIPSEVLGPMSIGFTSQARENIEAALLSIYLPEGQKPPLPASRHPPPRASGERRDEPRGPAR